VAESLARTREIGHVLSRIHESRGQSVSIEAFYTYPSRLAAFDRYRDSLLTSNPARVTAF
jgi:hypothetical protein